VNIWVCVCHCEVLNNQAARRLGRMCEYMGVCVCHCEVLNIQAARRLGRMCEYMGVCVSLRGVE